MAQVTIRSIEMEEQSGRRLVSKNEKPTSIELKKQINGTRLTIKSDTEQSIGTRTATNDALSLARMVYKESSKQTEFWNSQPSWSYLSLQPGSARRAFGRAFRRLSELTNEMPPLLRIAFEVALPTEIVDDAGPNENGSEGSHPSLDVVDRLHIMQSNPEDFVMELRTQLREKDIPLSMVQGVLVSEPIVRRQVVQFVTGPWADCGAGGNLCASTSTKIILRERQGWCADVEHLNVALNESLCEDLPAPILQEPCPVEDLPPCGWFTTDWSPCSPGPEAPCDEKWGWQKRTVKCLSADGHSECPGNRPRAKRGCLLDPKLGSSNCFLQTPAKNDTHAKNDTPAQSEEELPKILPGSPQSLNSSFQLNETLHPQILVEKPTEPEDDTSGLNQDSQPVETKIAIVAVCAILTIGLAILIRIWRKKLYSQKNQSYLQGKGRSSTWQRTCAVRLGYFRQYKQGSFASGAQERSFANSWSMLDQEQQAARKSITTAKIATCSE